MSASAIYDFETLIPAAVKPVFVDAGLKVWIISDDPEFQKIRPRVEIVYRHMGEEKPRRWANLPDGSRRGAAFIGELKLHAITDADIPGKISHATYRVTVRNFLAAGPFQDLINGSDLLPFHKIQWLEMGNEETGVRTNDGYQQTTFPFSVKLSIQRNAWAQLDE